MTSQPAPEPAGSGDGHVEPPILGMPTGLLTGIQLLGMIGLVAGLGAVVAGTEASLSAWSFVLSAVAVVVVGRSTSVLTAAGWLLLGLLVAVLLAAWVPLPSFVAPGVPVIVGSAVVLAATGVAVAARRDPPIGPDGAARRDLGVRVTAIAYGVPLVVIVGSVLLSLVLRG